MTAPSADETPVVADLLDAIDPDLTEDTHLDALERACRADAVFSAAWLATVLREMVEHLAVARGVPAEALLRPMRQRSVGPAD